MNLKVCLCIPDPVERGTLVTEGTSAFVSVTDGLVCTTGPEISKPVVGFSTLNLI